MKSKAKYYLSSGGEFVIENYHLTRPFSSFFPGIAGMWGVPIWVFYVNRGQAISSFGIKDKDHPVLEFRPANQAYQTASILGFRTLIKVKAAKGKDVFYDAFNSSVEQQGFDISNKMFIRSSEIRLAETNPALGLETGIEYFTIPNDNYGALARRLTLRNISKRRLDLEFLDGLPQIIPYGMNNFFLKEMSRTIEAWMDVEGLEDKAVFLRLKVDPADRPEVVRISEGNFYLAFNDKGGLVRPIVEPQAIFGWVSDFSYPQTFMDQANFSYPRKQLTNSRTPCCFAYQKLSLKPKEEFSLYSLSGNMDSLQKLKTNLKRISNKEYFQDRQSQNRALVSGIEENVWTHSSSVVFDLYCRQNFLDNVLRGGYPVQIDTDKGAMNIQLYSRKHGDLERDYNRFLLEPGYLSQGNGNYRDANQNRRSDIWFNPGILESGLLTFFNLIQADGYNPLVLKPDNFIFQGEAGFLSEFFSPEEARQVSERLERPFTPGEFMSFIERNVLKGEKPFEGKERFLSLLLGASLRVLSAEHGEGFWVDHWSYCLELLEAYLGVYPDNLRHILLENKEFTFFDNSEVVRPRQERYVLKNGAVFQYHSVVNNHAKAALIKKRESFAHTLRIHNGEGEIYQTTLIVKMLSLIANKFACLDPFGAGVEMEANKPNWYDALNGLPGLLGSSVCESLELKRWVSFLKDSLESIGNDEEEVGLPSELYELLLGLERLSCGGLNDYAFWDESHNLREGYLRKTLLGFSGQEQGLGLGRLKSLLENYLKKIENGLKKAYNPKEKLYYSYFINQVAGYKAARENEQDNRIKPLSFKQIPLPLFLEGVMHSLRVVDNPGQARKIFAAARKSQLYDRKLKMYKVNAPLTAMPHEIGRCRVFTPGWLENESVWLHMEYKYILELLKNGLYEEFFTDFKNVLVPFQSPERYGRSVLENSSFIVSSVFPDERLHGGGFVARLSGSTAEFISIWLLMCCGKSPFYLDEEERLCLEFKPVLPAWLFGQKARNGFPGNTFAFRFLNKTTVVYHNPKRKDTFGPKGAKIKEITLEFPDRPKQILKQPVIPSPFSGEVRAGQVLRIDIVLD